jgi:DNA polymerase I-like protein with 3'-5' exonuclease and polymerase domains
MKLVFDVETTIRNKGNPYTASNRLISFSFFTEPNGAEFNYFNEPGFLTNLKLGLEQATLLIGLNLKFDIAWARRYNAVIPKGCRIWDCQLAEFILSGQTNSFASMESLCERYGIPGKEDAVAQYWAQGIDTDQIPVEILKEYGNGDVERTWKIYQAQLNDPRMTPKLHKLILLDGADLLVLQKMEQNGLKYNSEQSKTEAARLKGELNDIESFLNSLIPCPDIFNWDSGDHLSAFLYGGWIDVDRYEEVDLVYKSGPRKGESYKRNKFIRTDKYEFPGYFKPLKGSELAKSSDDRPIYSAAEPVLKQLTSRSERQKRIISSLLKRAELAKLVETYFVKLPQLIEEMEWENGIVHGQYNQVVARTGRLSSSKPNMQNNPSEVDRMFISRYS